MLLIRLVVTCIWGEGACTLFTSPSILQASYERPFDWIFSAVNVSATTQTLKTSLLSLSFGKLSVAEYYFCKVPMGDAPPAYLYGSTLLAHFKSSRILSSQPLGLLVSR